MPRFRFHITAVLALVVLTAAAAPQVVFSKLEARTEGATVQIKWQTAVEEDVASYTLERKTRFDTKFKPIKKLDPHGPNKPYEFKDDDVYKTSADVVEYRLKITFTNGTFQVTDPPLNVSYTTTAVRRTWGSIKAMFQ